MALLAALALSFSLITVGCARHSAPTPAGRIAVARVPDDVEPSGGRPGPPLQPQAVAPADVVVEPPKRAAASELVERADSAFLEGRDVAAATLVERAVGLDPTFPASYLLLARMHLERGDEELALTFLERAEQLAAQDPGVLADVESLRGVAFEEQGRRAAAVAAYERALRLAPDNARARGGLARLAGQSVAPD